MAKNPLAGKLKMHGHSAKTWTDSPSMPQEHGGSREQGTAVGSGSRPTKSSVKIDTSAPENCHTQDRDPPDPLK
jgi:hypothetical protein